MSETDKIIERYDRRKENVTDTKSNTLFSQYIKAERELKYKTILNNTFPDIHQVNLLEIGAGSGSNLVFFNQLGIPIENISGNELLPERVAELKKRIPEDKVFSGDAMNLPFKNKFDVVFQSTVFSSILDADFKAQLANKMWEMLGANGIILWYDFIYDNPWNKDVKGVPKNEVKKLFPKANKVTFYPVTVAPPIGRRIGKWYNLFNAVFPFLRTHIISVIHKGE